MKLGVCGSLGTAETIKKCGFDFVEENFSRLAAMTDGEFSDYAAGYEKLGVPVLSTNGFLPGGYVIYDKTPDETREYAARGMARAASLGVKTVVIGSGAQRNIPDGADREAFEAKFVSFVATVADVAEKYGIKVVVEPLARAETNLVNLVSESVAVAKRTGKKNVGAMVDFFHFFINGDDGLGCAEGLLFHAHLARANADRLMPTDKTEIPTLEKWAAMLRGIGYRGDLSLEGFFGDDLEKTLTKTRPLLDVFLK